MLKYPKSQTLPLITTEEGHIRLRGTRIGLDVLIAEFNKGMSPEEIAYNYPTASLADVYSVISYYLSQKAHVDEYLSELNTQGDEIRERAEQRYNLDQTRQRLLRQQNQG